MMNGSLEIDVAFADKDYEDVVDHLLKKMP